LVRLYDSRTSTNGYKVRLLLGMLGVGHQRVLLDAERGEHKTPGYLAICPRGQVPALEVDGAVIWDSAACLVYLARRYGGESWLPIDPLGLAEVQQWLALSSNEIQYGIQAARGILRLGRPGDLAECQARGRIALEVLEGRLGDQSWLACGRPTIADIACHAYVAVAGEAGLALDAYPNVRGWLRRIEGLPGWLPREP
jgi:glutathione S-transferase